MNKMSIDSNDANTPKEETIWDPLIVKAMPFPSSICENKIREFLLETLKLTPFDTIFNKKSSKVESYFIVSLYYEEETAACEAVDKIQNTEWQGNHFQAFIELSSKHKHRRVNELRKLYLSTPEETTDLKDWTEFMCQTTMRQKTIPYCTIPYAGQLRIKQDETSKTMRDTSKEMRKVGENSVRDWLSTQEKSGKPPYKLWEIRATHKIKGYRNKCEFTVGKDYCGKEVLIGFILTKLQKAKKLDYIPVGPIDNLVHIPQKMKDIAKVLEKYVRFSDIQPYSPWDTKACWSSVTMRTNQIGDVMVMITLEPRKAVDLNLEDVKSSLKKWYETEGQTAGVTSFYLRTVYPKVKGGQSEDEISLLYGAQYLEETLCNLSFRIAPDAFFQINTKGAELLYRTALELAEVDKETTVLDVCCGTGTIGIFFSQYCGEVLGVESVESAVANAKENARRNGVQNCEFFCGKAEDLLGPLIRRATKQKIVAIVDPPRAGLHKRAIWALRKERKIHRLVYISCEPRAAMYDWVDFARAPSKVYKGDPFVPVEAVPIDMFPHTNHCEVVVRLERLSEDKSTDLPPLPKKMRMASPEANSCPAELENTHMAESDGSAS